MLDQLPILSAITFFPTIGAVLILALKIAMRKSDQTLMEKNVRGAALFVTGFVFILTCWLALDFDKSATGYQFVEQVSWLSAVGINYKLGVDGMSVLLIVLTGFLMPICVLASWKVETRVADYMAAFLLLETLIMGVFSSLDIILFYIFFEGSLIPMFLIIGVWGGANRIYAAFKFFLYTFLGSILMLVAMIVMFIQAGTTDIEALQAFEFGAQVQTWLWLAFFASFAVKMPMWPVHTWLPDAHVQAPTAGSVLLAGVLLKLGGYGFLRFSIPMFPNASELFAPLVFVLSIIAIVYTSIVAFRQTDIKKLIAYSSVAHMGFVTMGIFSMTDVGVQGAIFQMISHGLISAALFLCVGVIYDRFHTREIAFYGGLVHKMPVYAAIFGLFTMANVGLPGTSGFVGEIMTMAGVFQVDPRVAAGAALGVIFSAVYMLTLYKKVVFGEMTNEKLNIATDLDTREWINLGVLAALTIYFGFFTTPITDFTTTAVDALVHHYNAALAAPAS
ncbi:NADH-quinone oxidoreductase subunit M [Woodsholea maritima]|uniref:NADH-quinone oxidoreductase subunit M n=1 Tax=Woodsholea maritima TaxID=240237 RepID=UPI00035CA548|nr:NADH-quinone oxidoreductase subunit M [Woodsholea maritima]